MEERLKSKEIERQIIEKELQRQRMMAISGRTSKTGTDSIEKSSHPREIIRLKREVQEEKSANRDGGAHNEQSDLAEELPPVQKKRRIIIHKKTTQPISKDTSVDEQENLGFVRDNDESFSLTLPGDYETQDDGEDKKVGLKNSAYKSKDHIFEGKGIQKTTVPHAKDSVLIHTELKSKKNIRESKSVEDIPENSDEIPDQSTKQGNKIQKK
jgi:hypothetical protein